MNPNINEPAPKPHKIIPVTHPFIYGAHSQPIIKDVKYPAPIPIGNNTPNRTVKSPKVGINDDPRTANIDSDVDIVIISLLLIFFWKYAPIGLVSIWKKDNKGIIIKVLLNVMFGS